MDGRPNSPEIRDRHNLTRSPKGPSLRRCHSSRPGALSPSDGKTQQFSFQQMILIVIKDSNGYGMKVSGDNPVYVQSVKDGGAAEKAGLQMGDKILKVNGTDVTHSTHTEVVELIKSSVEVHLTVQKRVQNAPPRPPQPAPTSPKVASSSSSSPMSPTSPTHSTTSPPSGGTASRPLHHHLTAPARDRITGPQPVDHEKLRQLECQRVQTFRLMLEKEQRYVEALRSELAKCSDLSNEQQISGELMGAERRVRTLQEQLASIGSPIKVSNGHSMRSDDSQCNKIPPPPPPLSTLPTRLAAEALAQSNLQNQNQSPPALPVRMRSATSPVLGSSPTPPPLPPRQYSLSPASPGEDGMSNNSTSVSSNFDSTLSPLPVHHGRTISSPDFLESISNANACDHKMAASESLGDLTNVKQSGGGLAWNVATPGAAAATPPGTPPPPYRGSCDKNAMSTGNAISSSGAADEGDNARDEGVHSPVTDLSFANTSTSMVTQTSIISMEDDDMSDQEVNQLEDHGPFKNLSTLWKHNAHLAVFLNYVISNSDPASLLFYLVTDLYKEGTAKEMKKWAYEIHSSFLVPGAPLRLNNVDENIAREIDDVLLKESDKEEILRKVFWKARLKAKEELNEQLADFQQKRTAGLGTLFGPPDTFLDESIHDKSKEVKIVEQILLPKMEPFIEDMERDAVNDRRFTTAAALGTILAKTFGVRGPHFNSLLERCPTFVSKEKSFKARIIGRSRKMTIRGHHFVAHQYFTVTYCNHCQMIIWGIGPQGYKCTNCHLNIHRHCTKSLDENCPGPLLKKERTNDRIVDRIMDRIRPERAETRRKPSSVNVTPPEKLKKQEEREDALTDNEIGEKGNASGKGRVDTVKETEEKSGVGLSGAQNESNQRAENQFLTDIIQANDQIICKPGTSINRSESCSERIQNKRQIRERRKTSDPNLSKTNADAEGDNHNQFGYATANSASSSNSNLSTRSLDSPSASLEVVASGGGKEGIPLVPNNICQSLNRSAWDSDTEAEPDPPDWTRTVCEEVLKRLTVAQKKRQEVINELFHTERSHVRALKILDQLFYQPLKELQYLSPDHLQLLFPNLEEMLDIHSQFNNMMKVRKKENSLVGDIGDILLKMFDGMEGDAFEKAAATFCSRQQIALEALKEKRRKDAKLNAFLCEAEGNPICRRLQLKDIIPTGMLRLTKYPLLFENLWKYTEKSTDEERNVQRALERSKEILNWVNQAVKEAEDEHRLAEIQKRLDKAPFEKVEHPVTSEFKNLDLTKHKLIHEGALNWKITSNKQNIKLIDLHVLLLEDVVILLQKQDEKYVLKFYTSSGATERTPILSPIVKVSTLIVRHNATDKTGLYLVNTSLNSAQIYNLFAPSTLEKETWFRHLSQAADSYKAKDSKHKNSKPLESSPSNVSATNHDFETESKYQKEGEESDINALHNNSDCNADDTRSISNQNLHVNAKKSNERGGSASPGQRKKKVEPPRLVMESPLIEPSQVLVSQKSIMTAEPVLTPLERLRRKDELIRTALVEKRKLAADILHVAVEEDENVSSEMAPVELTTFDKEAAELVLGVVNKANELTSTLNDGLKVTEEERILATCSDVGKNRTLPSPLLSIPVATLQPISAALNAQLTQLLNVMKERDEEREKLRSELQKSREQLHAMHERVQHMEEAQSPPLPPNPS